MDIIVRIENSEDLPAVRAVNDAAFGRDVEGRLVDKLRESSPRFLSLVAEADGQVAGHIAFSPIVIQGEGGPLEGMALAPLAVLPAFQCKGIGSALTRAGLERLRAEGVPYSIVLGHPTYYPRFGYQPASRWGVMCEYPGVPDDVFMLLPLDEGAAIPSGTAFYRAEFAEFE